MTGGYWDCPCGHPIWHHARTDYTDTDHRHPCTRCTCADWHRPEPVTVPVPVPRVVSQESRPAPLICPQCGMPDVREVSREQDGIYYVDRRCLDCGYEDRDHHGGI